MTYTVISCRVWTDGPHSENESVRMAEIACRDGISTIVATPHIKDRVIPVELIRQRVCSLNDRLQEEGIGVEIISGADVYALLDPSIICSYTVSNTDYVLLEFPHTHIPRNAGEILFQVISAGKVPIITHPERNPTVIRRPETVMEFASEGLLLQITADSLLGRMGRDVMECARFLLSRGVVHFIASDAHSFRGRVPVLSEALEVASRTIGSERALRLVRDNPMSVIRGEGLVYSD
ncbi:MAG TPA: hypothetical protein ENH50_02625 [Nitrospirae bacterium]|nr:tyrosine-protein phosphatase YwqE [bacterium BMS3Abin08]HDY70542.1 hypothetical protein [Nitrospirota bacterium]